MAIVYKWLGKRERFQFFQRVSRSIVINPDSSSNSLDQEKSMTIKEKKNKKATFGNPNVQQSFVER